MATPLSYSDQKSTNGEQYLFGGSDSPVEAIKLRICATSILFDNIHNGVEDGSSMQEINL